MAVGVIALVALRVARTVSTRVLGWMHRNKQDSLQPIEVLCAYDGTATADAALGYLRDLLSIGLCEIVVAQVSPLNEIQRLGVPSPMPQDANLPEIQEILRRDLQDKIKAGLAPRYPSAYGWREAEPRLRPLRPAEPPQEWPTGTARSSAGPDRPPAVRLNLFIQIQRSL